MYGTFSSFVQNFASIARRVLEIWLFLYKAFTKVKTEKTQCLGGVFTLLNVSVYASVSRILENVWPSSGLTRAKSARFTSTLSAL